MERRRYEIIIRCKLKYIVIANSLKEAKIEAEDIELPEQYVNDSFIIMEIKEA